MVLMMGVESAAAKGAQSVVLIELVHKSETKGRIA